MSEQRQDDLDFCETHGHGCRSLKYRREHTPAGTPALDAATNYGVCRPVTPQAEISLEGDAERTLITARRADEIQQLALTQAEALALCTALMAHNPHAPSARQARLVRELAGNYHNGLVSAEAAMDAITAMVL